MDRDWNGYEKYRDCLHIVLVTSDKECAWVVDISRIIKFASVWSMVQQFDIMHAYMYDVMYKYGHIPWNCTQRCTGCTLLKYQCKVAQLGILHAATNAVLGHAPTA